MILQREKVVKLKLEKREVEYNNDEDSDSTISGGTIEEPVVEPVFLPSPLINLGRVPFEFPAVPRNEMPLPIEQSDSEDILLSEDSDL